MDMIIRGLRTPTYSYILRQSLLTRSFSASENRFSPLSPDLLGLSKLTDESHHLTATKWLSEFTINDIPKTAYDITYSRSSGPGGQHVNTTSSKATLRCPLKTATNVWLPRFLLDPLSKTTYYLPNPPSLLISNQESRSAPTNAQHTVTALHRIILEAGKSVVMGETSQDQKDKVKRLAAADGKRRRMEKEKRSSKKRDRKGE